MAETNETAGKTQHPLAVTRTELVWEGKYDSAGNRVAPLRVALPFQTVETVNESTEDRRHTLELFGQHRQTEWRNRLIWGDKKYVLPSLLAEFAGKVNLIYIDPPFDTGADFSFTASVPNHADGEEDDAATFTKEPSIIEHKAYRDTWGRGLDSYMQWFYETTVLLHELLHDTGSLYVHLDWHVGHYAKCVLDEVFCKENFVNEIVRVKCNPKNYTARSFGNIHDVIYSYSKTDEYAWNRILGPVTPQDLDEDFPSIEEKTGRHYATVPLHAPGIRYGVTGKQWKGISPPKGRHWAFVPETLDKFEREKRIEWSESGNPRLKMYADECPGYPVQDIWTDFKDTRQDIYATQKPEALLERIVKAASSEGDLVLDCFCGSGTTAVVAERLKRRWIACDLGRFAIHTARKRLLSISGVRPFIVQNLGKYERQLWQQEEFKVQNPKSKVAAEERQRDYVQFILKLYQAKPLNDYSWLHGVKGGRMVHVGAVDAPVSVDDVAQIAAEFKRAVGTGKDAPKTNGVDLLGWDFAFEMNEVAKQQAAAANIRDKVKAWRDGGYKGATDTTRLLLNHWFCTDHRLPTGGKFKYHYFQREAVETLIYLYEVAGIRRHKSLVETFATRRDLRLLQYDDFARYCAKMATGSGKTKVMSLVMAWQFFNAVAEARDDFAKTFLLIAPNVIVFERLRTDFEGGQIFNTDPVIPNELRVFWDFQCYMRGEGERAGSLGALYLTNIQQFYERQESVSYEPDALREVLGEKPPVEKLAVEDIDKRIIARGGPLAVVNDEAHHTHDEESEWNKIIRRLNKETPKGVAAQFDFTATPRHSKGQLFSWTVFDYPLKQAILDNVVKRPLKGIAKGITEQRSNIASTRYQAYLAAGVERWKEYRDQLKTFGKKPVLFVMMNDTEEADDVGDWLQKKYPSEFGTDKLLVIHTDKTGDVSKKDLDKARKVSREVDHEASPVNCIVSVLMLREGWDVQGVTVIVGLRPYSSKANILPEQTVGRGLRLMFRGTGSGYIEHVDVIGNNAFIEFVEQLEREEELQLQTFELGKEKVVIVTIAPDERKTDKDIPIPMLSPVLTRKKSLAEEIAEMDVTKFKCPVLPRKEGDSVSKTFRYEGYDIITLQRLIERQYKIPEPQTSEEVIGYYARRIAQDVKLPSQFSALAPKVREFLEKKAFGEQVDLNEPAILKAISSNVAQYVTVKTFVEALRKVVLLELEPQLLHAGRLLSETPPFPWSRPTLKASKCVFNLVPCFNEFEKEFAQFLEKAEDVARFAKLPEQFGFAIDYTDNVSNFRRYEPDFVVVTNDGRHHLVETKGLEDVNVANKDRAAVLWCENTTRLTGKEWDYLKVLQTEYKSLQPSQFSDLGTLGKQNLL